MKDGLKILKYSIEIVETLIVQYFHVHSLFEHLLGQHLGQHVSLFEQHFRQHVGFNL